MPYDYLGRTPEMARKQRVREWLCVLVLALMVAGIVTCATLVVMMLGG